MRLGQRGTYWSCLFFFMFTMLLNGLLMLDERKFEKSRMVVDCTLSSAFRGYVSKREPIFFHYPFVATFFIVGYMIATLFFKCSRSTRPKNWRSCLREWNLRTLWSRFLFFSTSNKFPSWLKIIPIVHVSHIMKFAS